MPAFLVKPARSLTIVFLLFIMLPTIQLNSQMSRAAGEIQNVVIYRMLSTKFIIFETAAAQ
ncbi:hypothetical protein APT79_06150 [Enterobacter sp. K66-74]|nr:hypothetical protein APT79_06150 [Enterobacter sp. K66-74]OJX40041.1 MAG: hypothetical protein BGO85_18140 [Enterobacter sp. 56-7]